MLSDLSDALHLVSFLRALLALDSIIPAFVTIILAFLLACRMEEGIDESEEEDSSAICCVPRHCHSDSLHMCFPERIRGSGSVGAMFSGARLWFALATWFSLTDLSNITVQLHTQ